MKLKQSKKDLKALLNYLRRQHSLDVPYVTLRHDPEHDEENSYDPRAFCYVDPHQRSIIFCAAALECLPQEARIGVLLHEIGHIVLDAFDGDESEVDVDEWCLKDVPESGYTYTDVRYIGGDGAPRIAKNLESVSQSFLDRLNPGEIR